MPEDMTEGMPGEMPEAMSEKIRMMCSILLRETGGFVIKCRVSFEG